MNEVVIFRGPTISVEACKVVIDAIFLPPAAQGDVYRVARRAPRAIGIIDGTFERSPAIWHKEILWALSQGIHVFGASSMGALRAAELCSFGMEGVGLVFEWFRDGTLEDDDEVAVAHADGSLDYRVLSEAMVNIRATLRAAERRGVITQKTLESLIRHAKSLYYPERTYPALLHVARRAGLSEDVLEAFAAFLPTGVVNQKRQDALAMLQRMSELTPSFSTPRIVDWSFEHTDAWDQVVARVAKTSAPSELSAQSDESVLIAEELRLRGELLTLTRRGALLRSLADQQAARSGLVVTAALRDVTQDVFRRERGLEESQAVWQWLSHNQLDEQAFGRFLEAEARLRWLYAMHPNDDESYVVAELIASGQYAALRVRAQRKQDQLTRRGLLEPELADAGFDFSQLLHWYFEVRLERAQPRDFPAYLQQAGLASAEAFTREALREYFFLKFQDAGD